MDHSSWEKGIEIAEVGHYERSLSPLAPLHHPGSLFCLQFFQLSIVLRVAILLLSIQFTFFESSAPKHPQFSTLTTTIPLIESQNIEDIYIEDSSFMVLSTWLIVWSLCCGAIAQYCVVSCQDPVLTDSSYQSALGLGMRLSTVDVVGAVGIRLCHFTNY